LVERAVVLRQGRVIMDGPLEQVVQGNQVQAPQAAQPMNSSTQPSRVQSLEGGILDRLLVKEGDLVEVGQPLVRLDETRFLTNFQESANQASVLRAAIARLDAEVLGKKSIEFPPDVDPEGPLARSERELFKSRRDKLVEGTQAIQRQIHLAQSQLDLVRPLVAKRAVSQMEALKLSQDIATLSGKLTELKSTYFQDAYT
ncbi:biotin/lipoyl-binding protein, partial [Shigella sonnei]|nr:biotin/lipoyl-binding protein [Shigella sonnei]